MAVTGADVVNEARSWLGVPWRHLGRNRQGVDCVGLLVVVARALRISEHDDTSYPRRPDGSFLRRFGEVMQAKPLKEAADGDVLVFAHRDHPGHCGIRATRFGRPSLIHSHARRRHVIEEELAQAIPGIGRPVACYALPGVEEA